jgi:hypothetical protein
VQQNAIELVDPHSPLGVPDMLDNHSHHPWFAKREVLAFKLKDF